MLSFGTARRSRCKDRVLKNMRGTTHLGVHNDAFDRSCFWAARGRKRRLVFPAFQHQNFAIVRPNEQALAVVRNPRMACVVWLR